MAWVRYVFMGFVALTVLLALPAAGDSGRASAEDPTGDVDLDRLTTVQTDPISDEAETHGDLTSVSIGEEAAQAVILTVTLADMPDPVEASNQGTLGLPGTAPDPLFLNVWGLLEVDEVDYRVRTVLDDSSGELQATHELYRESNLLGEIAGTVDPPNDLLHVTIFKSSLGNPDPGSRATDLAALTTLPEDRHDLETDVLLDHAPSAYTASSSLDQDPLDVDPANIGLEVPDGNDFIFGSSDSEPDPENDPPETGPETEEPDGNEREEAEPAEESAREDQRPRDEASTEQANEYHSSDRASMPEGASNPATPEDEAEGAEDPDTATNGSSSNNTLDDPGKKAPAIGLLVVLTATGLLARLGRRGRAS